MDEPVWFVGIWSPHTEHYKVFYTTKTFVLARRMFLLLLDLGYENAFTNAHWESQDLTSE